MTLKPRVSAVNENRISEKMNYQQLEEHVGRDGILFCAGFFAL